MTVKELIEALENEDPEAQVHIAYNYGDYWRTQVAPKVRKVEESNVRWSEYHRMPRTVDEDDDENDKDESVVIISE